MTTVIFCDKIFLLVSKYLSCDLGLHWNWPFLGALCLTIKNNLFIYGPASYLKNDTQCVMYLCTTFSYFFRLDKRFNEQMLCDSCYHENIQMKATCFCIRCNCPELLCKACAQVHVRQKSTLNHKICNDLNLFPSTQKASNEE